ncbi:IgG-binding virulence factor TspB family protein [Neisseria sp. P0019.S002]|uniref:IgG-binding virulence factor TspB family protein n=1 Tax=Neisseria sp. P0019.S002 TaxID=3436798 RepID=UPI003F7D0456
MMKILQRLFITVVILLGFNISFADVDIHVEKNGRMRVPAGGFNQNGIRPWMYLDSNGPKFHHEYVSRFDKSLHVREASTGLRSASTVPVTIEQKVSRSTVLKNLLSKARVGGKFARVGGGPVGFAVSTAAFYLVDAALSKEGYEYNTDHENFGKTEPNYGYCVSALNSNYCTEYRIETKKDYWQEGAANNEKLKKAMCNLAYAKGLFFNPVPFTPDEIRVEGDWCVAYQKSENGETKPSVLMSVISYVKYKGKFSPISQSEFDRIIGPKADSSPSQYVNATANEDGSIPGESQSTLTVPNGTVITLGPATGQDGRPFQITISFTTGSDGNTSAKVTTTPRPDLTPGGSEAPNTKPDPDPAPNPDGKPDKKPDDKPDSDDKPDKRPDDDPSNKRKEDKKEDKKDDKKEESKGLLCNVFPDILACSEKGDVEEQEEPFKIPHTNNETTFSPDFFLPENGVCPAPRTATYLGITMEFKYDMICNFAEMIRFLVIGIAAVAAAFIMFSSRKD